MIRTYLLTFLISVQALAADLVVTIPPLKADKQGSLGLIKLYMCDSEDCYNDLDEPVHKFPIINRRRKDLPLRQVPVAGETTVYVFKNLPGGDYSINLHHDRDSDGEVQTNTCGFGRPWDGIGFSNNIDPRDLLRTPYWGEVKFHLNEDEVKTMTIEALYICDDSSFTW